MNSMNITDDFSKFSDLDILDKLSDSNISVSVFNVIDTIKNHYSKAKIVYNNNTTYFCINGYCLPYRFGYMFYKLMWYKYLKENISLVKYLKNDVNFNSLTDKLNPHILNIIKTFITDRYSLYNSCSELLDILHKKNNIIIENDDIFNTYSDIIGHQVNAQGVMGSGLAKYIKEYFPEAYNEYKSHPLLKKKEILGHCQLIKSKNKIIANLFSQFSYGRDNNIVYNNYSSLREALIKLKNYAKQNNLTVALPYNIGCGLANGDWDIVYFILKEVFSDYYLILYKK